VCMLLAWSRLLDARSSNRFAHYACVMRYAADARAALTTTTTTTYTYSFYWHE